MNYSMMVYMPNNSYGKSIVIGTNENSKEMVWDDDFLAHLTESELKRIKGFKHTSLIGRVVIGNFAKDLVDGGVVLLKRGNTVFSGRMKLTH